MDFNLRTVIMKMTQLTMLHRYYLHKTVFQGIYPGQPPILEYLSKHESSTQRELADFIGVSPSSVAVSLKRMQKAGFVEKTADQTDMRYNQIRITSEGREICARCYSEFEKIDNRMFKGFSDEEIERFYDYIERMSKNLEMDDVSKEEVFKFFHRE